MLQTDEFEIYDLCTFISEAYYSKNKMDIQKYEELKVQVQKMNGFIDVLNKKDEFYKKTKQ